MTVLSYLPPGSVTLHGVLGKALHNAILNRLNGINYQALVDIFRYRNETDNRWRCEFWGKIVRSAVRCLAFERNPQLERLIRDTVADLLSTQTPDGCISSYPQEKQLGGWDIWGRKYVMLALLRYYDELDAAPETASALVRMLDHLIRQLEGRPLKTFGEHQGMAACSILGAVVGIYRITGEKRFLDFARGIVQSGACTRHNIYEEIRKGTPPSGIATAKAYEMMSCFQGMAELSQFDPDPVYLNTVQKFFEDVRDQEIFITGGGGILDSVGEYWDHGRQKQTRSDAGAIGETCVTVTYQHLCDILLRLTGSPAPALEETHTACNALLGAVRHDGRFWCHANPTPLAAASSKNPCCDHMLQQGAEPFHGHDCCLAQGPEGLALAAADAVLKSPDGLSIQYYEDMDVDLHAVCGHPGRLVICGGYPFSGRVKLQIQLEHPAEFELRLLIPAWQKTPFAVRRNKESCPAVPGEYLEMKQIWHNGDQLELDFDVSLRKITSPDGRYVTLAAGPLLFCRDSRLGDVNAPVPTDLQWKAVDPEPFGPIHAVRELSDGSKVCDYISAGGLFLPGNLLRVWMESK